MTAVSSLIYTLKSCGVFDDFLKELGCHKSVVRKKLKQAGIDDFEFVVEQDKLLVMKIESMRQQGLSYQRITDLFNLWRIDTRSGGGQWYAKTVRGIVK